MATAKRSTKKPTRTKRPKRSPAVGRVRQAGRQTAPAKGDFKAALTGLARALAALGQPYSVIGGMAVIAHGHVRTTQDIDIAWVPPLRNAADVFLKQAATFELRPRIVNAGKFATENLVLLMEHQPTGIPVDISFALQDFEKIAAREATPMKVLGVSLPVVALDDLLVYKMIASRTQDIADVEMLLTSSKAIDSRRIHRTLAEFDAILETNRASDFDRLWRAARRTKR